MDERREWSQRHSWLAAFYFAVVFNVPATAWLVFLGGSIWIWFGVAMAIAMWIWAAHAFKGQWMPKTRGWPFARRE